MHKIYNTHESDILRMVYSGDTLKRMIEKEEAAKTLCGGYLGECVILGDMIDSFMVDAFATFKDKSWYRHEVKKMLKESHKALVANLKIARQNSISNKDVLIELLDRFYDRMKMEFQKMYFTTKNELNKRHIKDSECLAYIQCIGLLLQCNAMRYDETIEAMEKIVHSNYDAFYSHVRFTRAYELWDRAEQLLGKTGGFGDINYNEFDGLHNGIYAFINIFESVERSDIKKNVENDIGHDFGDEVFEEAKMKLAV